MHPQGQHYVSYGSNSSLIVRKLVDGLFLDCTREIAAKYPLIKYEEVIVDNACMQLVKNPQQFDVMVTGNIFGDILSDCAAMLTGSLGMLPSASLGAEKNGKRAALYEPVHGSAPDIAGKGIANPIATFWSGVMMLEHLGEASAAARLMRAIESVTANPALHPRDLGGTATTAEVTAATVRAIATG